jgi:LPXTG-site transpeptidase (sortase) family protein
MSSCRVATSNIRTLRAKLLRAMYFTFLTGGIVGLTYTSYSFWDASIYQVRKKAAFEMAQHKSVDTSVRQPVIDGAIMGELEVARLGLKVAVVQGDSFSILQRAVGHLPGTVLPGEVGNTALAGHRDTFFRPLRNIRSGDAITFKTLGGEFRYLVESADVVPPTDIGVLQSHGGRILTLITCFPFYYVGSAPNRFIVRARQIETWPKQIRTSQETP